VFNANNNNDIDHIANHHQQQTNTAPPSSQSTSSLVTSSIDNVNTLSTSAVATTAISTASTSALTETTIGANQTLQESHASAITMPAAQSPEDNIALIGGVVGGAVALLLIGALIAFCVVRSRRNNKEQPYADPSAHALQSRSSSNYGRIDGISGTANNPAKSTYVDVVVGPPANYDAWSDPNDYADTGVADRNHYDDFTKIQ
jgi:hypothetical protein